MGAHEGSVAPGRGRAGRHRRTGKALIERRVHATESPARRFSLPSPSPSALVGIAVLVLIGVGAVHLSGSGSAVPLEPEPTAMAEVVPESDPVTPSSTPTSVPASEGSAPVPLIVHVSGAVSSPGVVTLPPGSRVDDALLAAGGATTEADLSAVNLARPLADGEQIHVPLPGEEPQPMDSGPSGAAGPQSSESSGSSGSAVDGGTIDLNTASVAELEELPGVGPAIAQRIIEHRELNGPYTSVDGLLEVSGIGPATLEKIRDRATV